MLARCLAQCQGQLKCSMIRVLWLNWRFGKCPFIAEGRKMVGGQLETCESGGSLDWANDRGVPVPSCVDSPSKVFHFFIFTPVFWTTSGIWFWSQQLKWQSSFSCITIRESTRAWSIWKRLLFHGLRRCSENKLDQSASSACWELRRNSILAGCSS